MCSISLYFVACFLCPSQQTLACESVREIEVQILKHVSSQQHTPPLDGGNLLTLQYRYCFCVRQINDWLELYTANWFNTTALSGLGDIMGFRCTEGICRKC